MADGHLNKCKDCTKKDSEDRRAKLEAEDLEWVLKERERHRNKQAKRRKDGKATPLNHAEKNKQQEKNHPEKMWARRELRNAVKRGDIKRKPCFCGKKENVQAHHSDYSKPLDVEWLCIEHHNERHVQERDREIIKRMTKS